MQIILFGAGGHARVVADIAECLDIRVVAMVSESPSNVRGRRVVSSVEQARAEHPDAAWVVAIGDNFARRSVFLRLAQRFGMQSFATLIHPKAAVAADARLGAGTVVMAGAVINPGTRVGDHCIVNTGANIDHDCDVHDFASLAPGVVTGGNVRIGTAAAVSIGATVRHGVNIGEYTVVGAGAVVLGDLPPRCIAYGVPCRVVRPREENEPYL